MSWLIEGQNLNTGLHHTILDRETRITFSADEIRKLKAKPISDLLTAVLPSNWHRFL
jgi:hypothetical protein